MNVVVIPIISSTYLLNTVLITIQHVLQLEYCPRFSISDVLIHKLYPVCPIGVLFNIHTYRDDY